MTVKPLLFLLSVTVVSSGDGLSRSVPGLLQAGQLYKRQADRGNEVSQQQQGQELVGLKSFLKQLIPAPLEPVSSKLFLNIFTERNMQCHLFAGRSVGTGHNRRRVVSLVPPAPVGSSHRTKQT